MYNEKYETSIFLGEGLSGYKIINLLSVSYCPLSSHMLSFFSIIASPSMCWSVYMTKFSGIFFCLFCFGWGFLN